MRIRCQYRVYGTCVPRELSRLRTFLPVNFRAREHNPNLNRNRNRNPNPNPVTEELSCLGAKVFLARKFRLPQYRYTVHFHDSCPSAVKCCIAWLCRTGQRAALQCINLIRDPLCQVTTLFHTLRFLMIIAVSLSTFVTQQIALWWLSVSKPFPHVASLKFLCDEFTIYTITSQWWAQHWVDWQSVQ